VGLLDALSDHIADVVVVVDHDLDGDGRVPPGVHENGPLHGLGGGAAHVGGASVRAHLTVGGKDVHAFPCCDH